MRSIILALIWIYQKLFSPLFAGCCRFEPSCSEYARQAVLAHGSVKGGLLAAWRLLRCQPLCRGGFDPVPETWTWSLPTRKRV
ncbi:MAG: membrane protein insertion efficiency factor YidD [Desulfovibrionaceae bacterium]|nr:membrane protein insertion efficiency factor YidD [Desulfovibrionaceae bacterium]MDD4951151.1 membrane protein insertion efficiency factor YidD [Desulfovibrionaceae bacterium]